MTEFEQYQSKRQQMVLNKYKQYREEWGQFEERVRGKTQRENLRINSSVEHEERLRRQNYYNEQVKQVNSNDGYNQSTDTVWLNSLRACKEKKRVIKMPLLQQVCQTNFDYEPSIIHT